MGSFSPEVSIILPTFNRADTIIRAINSVLNQKFQDWELILIDDGSTDSTPQLIYGIDPRIYVIRQENQGVAAARNKGFLACKGRYITFLDSDDEWLPHFLDLSVSFMNSAPDEHYVTLEFLDGNTDFRKTKGSIVNTYLYEANVIGSCALDLPPGATDDYLRIFQSRQKIGAWGAKYLLDSAAPESFLYQGYVFHHTRWGYLAWLPTTVLTRHALEVVGNFDVRGRGAEDYYFLALLSRHFRTNFISVPSARKHELGLKSAAIKQDHLAIGPNYCTFRINRLHYFDQLHWQSNQQDRELSLIRKQYVYKTACIAMKLGLRKESISMFKEASSLQSHFWRAYFLRALVFLYIPHKMSSVFYRFMCRLLRV